MIPRVIPTLLLKNGGLVKGERFKNHRYLGDPINAVKIYNEKEVDELMFLDITASLEARSPNYEFIIDVASQAFMPFAYGGGITSLSEVELLFKYGVEKVVFNTCLFNDFSLVNFAARDAGSQSVVASIDVRKNLFGRYHVYTKSGSVNTKQSPIEVAKRAEQAGAGEIVICAIDREGTRRGYDLELIKQVSKAVDIPVVASGGASEVSDFRSAVNAGASAVAAGDMFCFHGKHKAVLITYPEYELIEKTFSDRVA